MSTDHRRRWLN